MEASELFGICEVLAKGQPSAEATRQLHEILVLTCAEGCRQQGGAFGNLFAQVDFLTKQLGWNVSQTIALQTARRHTNTGAPISLDDWPYDITAVARLISAVFKKSIPGSLLCLLPTNQQNKPTDLHINKAYIRCIVSRVEADAIYATTEADSIKIDYRNEEGGRDFAYLQKVVRPGMQLNLLDCYIDDADLPVVLPGQVIVEPDFLIDISSLAACFTDYGHHPLLYTLNRLKERPNTQAVLLGNFAGTALDDVINIGPEATVAASLQRSFREQALRFCACPDFDAEKFKLQAEEQMRNIREAMAALPQLPDGALLEPSFVCERLGLQGRVDMMTLPCTSSLDPRISSLLLVEQKAGRNMKIEHNSHDSHGLQIESHYVQLLLYYGILRYNFGLTDRQVDIRLLYSRYPAEQGLLTVNYYRTLLREAIRLRNQIVATELLIAREGFQRILPLLREDIIYKDVKRDAHFHRYVLPDLQTLNAHLSSLNSLERAYYERMLTFVYREQLASKLGSSETSLHHAGGCTSDLWQMPLNEKIDTGNILMGLTVEEAGEKEIRLALDKNCTLATINFRTGDMVYLYSYTDEPYVCNSTLHKGSLLELSADKLTVELNEEQHNPDVFSPQKKRLWAVEHGDSNTGINSGIRSLHCFITAAPRSKALLLGQRAPEADTSLRLSRSYHPDYDDVLLHIKQARDYFLLIGPPGTGKTSMALRYIVEEEINSSTNDHNLLLSAYTNRAVDEICAMLCEARIPFLRLGKAASCDKRFHPWLLDTALAGMCKLDEARQLIHNTNVIVGTTSMLQAQPWIMQLKHFALAIIDEASQILEPSIIGLLSSPSVERFVLIGDHKQLPAVVQQSPEQSAVSEQCLHDICLDNCRQSLFERLLRWEHKQQRTLFIGTLHTHGRMHPQVALFPLQHFYQREQLHAVPLPHQTEHSLGYDLPARDRLDELLQTQRLLFLPSEEEDDEARLVADLLNRIHRFTASHFDPSKTVGVIVPYRRQIALIRNALGASFPAVTIDTVERYQGSQRDVIIYSFGVSHAYQLDFLTATTFVDDDGTVVDRKLNVALTRARRQMIVVGQPALLTRVPIYQQLLTTYVET